MALLKELFLPMITALGIYANKGSADPLMPVDMLLPISLLGFVRSLMVEVVVDKAEKYKEFLKINGVT